MIDINLIRKTPDVVRENIRKKFQDSKLPLVDEVIELDRKNREAMQQADSLRNQRKVLSKEIGGLMKQGKKDEAEATKAKVNEMAEELARLEQLEEEYAAEIKKRTTARTSRSSASASRLCRISRCPTMWTSWRS